MKATCRTGSALLIVLGMLSFMVVSAVGLSIRMRASRMPSSYLRRNIAARELVKAGLARAIDELDGVYYSKKDGFDKNGFVGVYDDPYPGCVTDASEAANPLRNGDYWLNRVFMPLGSVEDEMDTVPTLAFEALAYLPPAILDDVRALARRTRTAMWHPLPYNAGRYAYCAVNVSDMFDINRLRANRARNSSANGRVTLASLCCTDPADAMSVDTSAAAELDTILDDVKNLGKVNGNVVPFTSLADFNFVAGPGCEWAPFMDYVGRDNNANLQKSGSAKAANALFVTDTWFPTTNDIAGTTFDLETSDGQPFKDLQSANNFLDVANVKNPGVAGKVFEANLGIGMVCLYDYLDRDNTPLSLALPTTEAVPMVVGVSSPGGIQPQLGDLSASAKATFTVSGTADDGDGGQAPVEIVVNRTYTQYGLTMLGNKAMVQAVVASPFKRLATTGRAKSYTLRGLLRVWMAADGMGCRPDDDGGNLYPDKSLWQNSNNNVKNGVATFMSDSKTIPAFPDVKSAEKAVVEVQLMFSGLNNVNMPLYYKVREEVDEGATKAKYPTYKNFNPDPSNFKAEYKSLGDLKDNIRAFRPFDDKGGVDKAWREAAQASTFNVSTKYPNGLKEFDPASIPTEFRFYASLWIQVLDGGEVVDMVPACLKDDFEWYGVNIPAAGAVVRICGGGAPLLNFRGSEVIKYETVEDKLKQPVSFDWKSLYAVDPRFNFAPEDWFSSGSAAATGAEWIQLLGLDGGSSTLLGQDGRDRDMFMFVSDQEYLQSIGELQFLPILEDMDGSAPANMLSGQYSPNFHGRTLSERTTPTDLNKFANGGRFWRTYTAYNQGDGVDPLYGLPYQGKNYVFESGAGGFKLNPYSDDDRVIYSGLVGTPFDYYMASTNKAVNTKISGLKLNDMMKKYSFGEEVDCAKLTDNDLDGIAESISESFRAKARTGSSDWLSCWDDLGWQPFDSKYINNENKSFFGLDLSEPLHGVDRKFLYSFWRECFANRQQLYLIFVRAEPSVSSAGGANDRSSSQMGGRAVALVWRDPEVPSYNRSSRQSRSALQSAEAVLDARRDHPPHRTRVLFYHQFD